MTRLDTSLERAKIRTEMIQQTTKPGTVTTSYTPWQESKACCRSVWFVHGGHEG